MRSPMSDVVSDAWAPSTSTTTVGMRRFLLTITVMLCTLMIGRNSDAQAMDVGARGKLVVGGKNYTEQLVLSTITAQYLQSLGYEVSLKNGLGSSLMRAAQVSGELDVVWEYTGTSLILYNHVTQKLDANAAYARVKQLDARRGLVWLNQSAINNTYAIALPRNEAPDVTTISGLANKLRQDRPGTRHWLAMDAEFAGRSDGLRPMLALYGMHLPRRDIKQMDPGLVYTALHNGQVMAGVVYTTDGRVQGFDLRLLDDDRHYFPAYRATPVVRAATLAAYPALAAQLNALAGALDTPTMTSLNAAVDIDQKSIDRVARAFLLAHHLISMPGASSMSTGVPSREKEGGL